MARSPKKDSLAGKDSRKWMSSRLRIFSQVDFSHKLGKLTAGIILKGGSIGKGLLKANHRLLAKLSTLHVRRTPEMLPPRTVKLLHLLLLVEGCLGSRHKRLHKIKKKIRTR
ncbi:unnamed protein product [Cuscuta campestris]|uniref:Uncharacterized protein n=1 Tax=Cuscuta campestris TaxID=132261 RepID=A0A484L8T5_9ASTE|nr:unnamed protein product [Cuscuta campestris]